MKEWELHSQWVNDLPESIETIKQPSNLCGSVSLGSPPVPPLVLGFGQIDPAQQQRKLFVTQDDLALSIPGLRPGKSALSPTSWHRPRVRCHPRRVPLTDCAGRCRTRTGARSGAHTTIDPGPDRTALRTPCACR